MVTRFTGQYLNSPNAWVGYLSPNQMRQPKPTHTHTLPRGRPHSPTRYSLYNILSFRDVPHFLQHMITPQLAHVTLTHLYLFS